MTKIRATDPCARTDLTASHIEQRQRNLATILRRNRNSDWKGEEEHRRKNLQRTRFRG
jgi:hypothetical protein